MSTTPLPRGLYLITQEDADGQRLLERTQAIVEAGAVTWLQYRNRAADATARRRQASTLLTLCSSHGVALILNDDVQLALEIGAAGVHLEDSTLGPAAARAVLGPQALVGASCYDSALLAAQAVQAGASYVSFGAFFPSRSKPTTHRATPAVLRETAALGVPRVAIGGLTPDNARPAVEAGADLIAAIGGVYDARDPIATARAYRALFG